MVSRSTPQTFGRDQTSSMQARESDTSPQPDLILQPDQTRDTKYNANGSSQTTQSYMAYDPRSAVPAMTFRQRPDNRSSTTSGPADQNAELMEKLKALRIECDRKTTALDEMVSEIVENEGLLAEKEAEVARLSAELKQKTPQFSKMEELFKKREAEALEEKDRKIKTLQEEVNRLLTLNTDITSTENHNAELSDLRQRSSRLQQELIEKDGQLRQKDSALKAWESGWQVHMQQEKEKLEATLESRYSNSHSELREQIARREEAEARLRDFEIKQDTVEDARARVADEKIATALARADFQKSQSETYLQKLRELRDSNAVLSQQIEDTRKAQIDTAVLDQLKVELTEARRLANFFKKNSEQTSKTNKEAANANRTLQESLAAKTREVDDQNSLIQAMKLQLNDMGGQYSQY
jgi:hypothetical protein